MHQLSGLDASFLYLETPRAPMHVAGLQIYDPATAPGGEVSFERILDHVGTRLHLARTFRERLAKVPLRLDHPWWIVGDGFDLEYHVREIALPDPGDWHQLTTQVARLMSRPLDLRRPLWEIYVIRGLDAVPDLPTGCFALFTKIHHAAIDGVSGVEITGVLHTLDPDDPDPAGPDEPFRPEPEPDPAWLLGQAARNAAARPMHLARVVGRTVPAAGALLQGVRAQRMQLPPAPFTPPRTVFNGTVDPHRVFDGVTLPFSEFKVMRAPVPGATVNDVVLSIVGGGLRRYLSEQGELPAEPLVAMAPISVRTSDQTGTQGNQVAVMLVSLATDVADPVARLRTVQESTSNSKEVTNAIGARTLADYSEFVPSALAGLAARLYSRAGLANRHNPLFNTVVTNVPGPQYPIYFAGARNIRYYGVGPINDSMGLIHPVLSLDGTLTISFTSCRSMLPDPAPYAASLQQSFEDQLSAATTVAGPAKKARAKKAPATGRKRATSRPGAP